MKKRYALLLVVLGASGCLSNVSGNIRGDSPAKTVRSQEACDVTLTRDSATLPASRVEVGVLVAESHEFAEAGDLEDKLRASACANGVDHLLLTDERYHDLLAGSWARAVAYTNAEEALVSQR